MVDNKNQEIQFLEQNLHGLLLQKQTFEMEVAEIEASLKELEKSGDEVFKIIGQMMLKTDKDDLKKGLSERKKQISSNLDLLKKQETTILKNLGELKKQ